MSEKTNRKRSLYITLAWVAGISLGFLVLSMFVFKWTAGPAKELGLSGDKLKPCPDSPNCVCSEESRASHQVSPLKLPTPLPPKEIGSKVATMPGATLIKTLEGPVEDGTYGPVPAGQFLIHLEFRTPLIGFVDDVQLAGKSGDATLQVRSASRAGHSDLGVNRKRVEAIRLHLGANETVGKP